MCRLWCLLLNLTILFLLSCRTGPDDGQLFRSVWQDYRGNTANDGDPLRVATQATLTLSAKPGARRVCVRAVDVFGFEAEAAFTVPPCA